ncbi:hypothetical protein D9M72_363090 [compost metagenome]
MRKVAPAYSTLIVALRTCLNRTTDVSAAGFAWATASVATMSAQPASRMAHAAAAAICKCV